MASGTYTLLLTLDRPATVEVGALGERQFDAGAYAYVGSAFGPGGLEARIGRHRRLAAGRADVRHWHIDYLLPVATLREVYTAVGTAVECEVAGDLPGDRVAGFGASDCDCRSHLAFARSVATLTDRLESVYEDTTRSEAH